MERDARLMMAELARRLDQLEAQVQELREILERSDGQGARMANTPGQEPRLGACKPD